MTSKELKVGDWVSYKGDNYLITDSSDDDMVTITNEDNFDTRRVKELKPIPIIGVTLENNGWKHHINYGRHYYTKGTIDLCSIKDNGYTFIVSNQAIKHIHYVHELQNLLWALGLEDELKL